MKRTRLDKLGRIVIPIDFRRTLGISEGSELSLNLEGNEITIRRAEHYCKLCNHPIDNTDFIELCTRCISRVKRL